jgi:hypothetical protein
MQRVPEAALPLVKSPTVIDEIRPEGQVRTSFPAGGSRIRTLGPPATVELGAAGGARRDRCMPGAPFTWTKAGVELEIGFRDFEHLAVPFFAFSATFEICRDDRICHQGRIPNSGLKRDSLITSETSLIARFNSLQGRKKFPVRPIEGSACHITTMRTHPHAEATYRVVPLKDGTFGVEVVIPETYPTTVSAFATEAEAEAWIARHKSQVGSDISRQRVRKAGEDDPG